MATGKKPAVPKLGIVVATIDVFNPTEKDAAEAEIHSYFSQLIENGSIHPQSILTDRVMNPIQARQTADRLAREGVDAVAVYNIAFPNGQVFLALATHPSLACLPFAVVADPEPSTVEWATNAWCGAIMNNHVAKAIGKPVATMPGPASSPAFREEFERFLRVAKTIRFLRNDILVRFGDAPSGFHSASGDQMAFARVFGTMLETVDMTAVMEVFRTGAAKGYVSEEAFTEDDVQEVVARVCRGREVQVDADRIAKAARLYLSYRAIINANGYTSASMRCWPEQNEPYIGFSACLAMGLLVGNGDVTSASCEADWPMAVMQSMGTLLSGQPAYCLDWVNYTGGSQVVQLGHCGVGVCGCMEPDGRQREAIALHPVIRQGGKSIGPVLIGQFEYGPMTGICINQDRDGEFTILAFEGESSAATDVGMKYCAADLRVENYKKLNELVLEGGFPHHLAVARGHIAKDIRMLCRQLGVRYVNPDHS